MRTDDAVKELAGALESMRNWRADFVKAQMRMEQARAAYEYQRNRALNAVVSVEALLSLVNRDIDAPDPEAVP